MIKEISFLILAVAIGTGLAILLRQMKGISIKVLLTFSGAYLLGIGIFHLLPEVYEEHSHYYGIMIMLGFFVQLILEAFSKGLEHGHGHSELFTNKGLPFGVLLSLFLHAFLESIAIGGSHNHLSRDALLWGLLVHKVPVTIILYNMLCEFTKRVPVVLFWLILFALMAPLGVFVGSLLPALGDYSRELTAFVFGIFLHISTTILFEGNQSHGFNIMKYGVILAAFGLAWLSVSH
jgi:zinc and cadmium transporter